MNVLEHIWKQTNTKSLLDIGANVGTYSRYFKSCVPHGTVLMIEGNPDCENMLKFSELPYMIQCLSDNNRQVKLFKNPANPTCTGTSYYLEQTEHYNENNFITVQTKRLDDVVPATPFDFIKLDVQGAEMDIINGGERTIGSCRFLQLEMSLIEYNKGSPYLNTMMQFVYEKGFRIMAHVEDHFKDGKLIQMDFVFVNINQIS